MCRSDNPRRFVCDDDHQRKLDRVATDRNSHSIRAPLCIGERADTERTLGKRFGDGRGRPLRHRRGLSPRFRAELHVRRRRPTAGLGISQQVLHLAL